MNESKHIRPSGLRWIIPSTALILLVLVVSSLARPQPAKTRPEEGSDPGIARRTAIVAANERAGPAVVSVGTRRDVGYLRGRQLVVLPAYEPVPYLGSGVIIDGERGLVITNAHVLEGLDNFLVTLPDGRQLEATLLGSDPSNDLALLDVEATDLPEVPMGTSEDLMVGEWILAIGNPYGMHINDPHPTLTVGVISALHRDMSSGPQGRVYWDMIQTDAGINPGNSGGALVNTHGELIGINTFIISPSGSSAGIGFAIPVDRVRLIAEELRTRGRVRPIYRDFRAVPHEAWMSQRLDLPDVSGPVVYQMDLNGPAAGAGLELGDIITEINGQRVTRVNQLWNLLFTLRVGEPIQLTVVRSDGEHLIEYELIEDRN